MIAVHVVPRDDLVLHGTQGDDCPCGPTPERVDLAYGGVGWVMVHHSLDGRERDEPVRPVVTADASDRTCPCGEHDTPARTQPATWPAAVALAAETALVAVVVALVRRWRR